MNDNIRHASTVMMLRDNSETNSLEVFVQHRAGSMPFAPNSIGFPGGAQEKWDSSEKLYTNRAIITAIREVLEETGVLLVEDPEAWRKENPEIKDFYRKSLLRRTTTIQDVFDQLEVKPLTANEIKPMNRWVTPESVKESRRYDVSYFVTDQLNGQEPDGNTSESINSYWARPIELLEQFEHRIVRMLAPTWWHLKYLAAFTDAESALEGVKNIPEEYVDDRRRTERDMVDYYRVADIYGNFHAKQ